MNDLALKEQELSDEINPLVTFAVQLDIKSGADSIAAQNVLREIKARKSKVEDVFDPIVEAANRAHKEACAQKNRFWRPLDDAERTIRRKCGNWQMLENLRREEEERLANAKREEEERKRKEELERQAQAAEARGKTEKAEALREKAENFAAPPVFVPPPPPKNGTILRKTWKAEVTDMRALMASIARGVAPMNLLIVDQSALNKYAKVIRDTLPVEGLRFFEEADLSVRK